jgi:protein required for attachment to host cells
MQLAHGTIVAVADGEKLTLYRNGGSETAPHLVAIGSPGVGDHVSDAGSRHHGGAANPSDRQLDEDGFAAATAGVLNTMALTNEIDALVVIAPPKTLGELRKHWHKVLAAKIVGELGKEMTGASVTEIAAMLAKYEAPSHGAVDA